MNHQIQTIHQSGANQTNDGELGVVQNHVQETKEVSNVQSVFISVTPLFVTQLNFVKSHEITIFVHDISKLFNCVHQAENHQSHLYLGNVVSNTHSNVILFIASTPCQL